MHVKLNSITATTKLSELSLGPASKYYLLIYKIPSLPSHHRSESEALDDYRYDTYIRYTRRPMALTATVQACLDVRYVSSLSSETREGGLASGDEVHSANWAQI